MHIAIILSGTALLAAGVTAGATQLLAPRTPQATAPTLSFGTTIAPDAKPIDRSDNAPVAAIVSAMPSADVAANDAPRISVIRNNEYAPRNTLTLRQELNAAGVAIAPIDTTAPMRSFATIQTSSETNIIDQQPWMVGVFR